MIHSGTRFGATWWGRLWLDSLEKLGDDYEFRLHRGKQYAEDGVVSHFSVQPGLIQAKVHGRKTYDTTLALPALTPAQWDRALGRIAQQSRFVASLLAGEMPQGLDEIFRESGASLYPRVPKELQMHCTCPDWANPCKHLAAVCYVMAEVLDRDPWMLFDLRGKSKEEVLASLSSLSVSGNADQRPKRQGRGHGQTTLLDIVTKSGDTAEPWRTVPADAFDMPGQLPSIVIPRTISPDPSVFVQLGPLPHARIESSICLAALMYRTAQVVQKQIEDGYGEMEGGRAAEQAAPTEPAEQAEPETVSPYETPLPEQPTPRTHRHWRNRNRRSGQAARQAAPTEQTVAAEPAEQDPADEAPKKPGRTARRHTHNRGRRGEHAAEQTTQAEPAEQEPTDDTPAPKQPGPRTRRHTHNRGRRSGQATGQTVQAEPAEQEPTDEAPAPKQPGPRTRRHQRGRPRRSGQLT